MFYTNEDIFNNDTPRKIFSYCTKTNVKGVITHYRLVHTGIEFMLQNEKRTIPMKLHQQVFLMEKNGPIVTTMKLHKL